MHNPNCRDERQSWSHLNGDHRRLACAAALCVRCCTLHALLHVACAAARFVRCCTSVRYCTLRVLCCTLCELLQFVCVAALGCAVLGVRCCTLRALLHFSYVIVWVSSPWAGGWDKIASTSAMTHSHRWCAVGTSVPPWPHVRPKHMGECHGGLILKRLKA